MNKLCHLFPVVSASMEDKSCTGIVQLWRTNYNRISTDGNTPTKPTAVCDDFLLLFPLLSLQQEDGSESTFRNSDDHGFPADVAGQVRDAMPCLLCDKLLPNSRRGVACRCQSNGEEQTNGKQMYRFHDKSPSDFTVG